MLGFEALKLMTESPADNSSSGSRSGDSAFRSEALMSRHFAVDAKTSIGLSRMSSNQISGLAAVFTLVTKRWTGISSSADAIRAI